jgi:hypothetical protein
MKLFIALSLALVLSPLAVEASVAISTIVECSTIADSTNGTTFDACATWFAEGPSPAMFPNGSVVLLGQFRNEYSIVLGLKEGADTFSLSDEEREAAFGNGIIVTVQRESDGNKCEVSTKVKGDLNVCNSCSFCGEVAYSADCTNLKNGRNVTCEATGTGDVFFPYTSLALTTPSTKAPLAVIISAPVAAPKAKVPTPKLRPPVSAPKVVSPPVKAPRKVRAPTKAPRKVRAPTKAPRRPIVRAPVKVAAPVKAAAPKSYNFFNRAPVAAPKK